MSCPVSTSSFLRTTKTFCAPIVRVIYDETFVLFRLDAGTSEKILLSSEQNKLLIVASYNDIQRALEVLGCNFIQSSALFVAFTFAPFINQASYQTLADAGSSTLDCGPTSFCPMMILSNAIAAVCIEGTTSIGRAPRRQM